MNAIGGAATFATGMGLAASNDNQSINENTVENVTHLSKMGADEKALSEATTGLGLDQTQALRKLMTGSFALSPQEQAQLDAMYAPQEANLRRFANLVGQDLAGTRGLNPSDTPVSEAVLREVLPAMANLQTTKMGQGFGLGMQMRGLNLQSALGMPGASGFNLQKLFNERLATGRTITKQRGTFNPGFLDRLATASGAQKNFTAAGADLAGGSSTGDAMGSAKMIGAMFSDKRLKRDITPVSWKWKDGIDGEYIGVIAQDVEQSHPHLVSRNQDGHLMVDYGAMVAMLLSEREDLYRRLEQYEGAA